jgi:hypothetical protein
VTASTSAAHEGPRETDEVTPMFRTINVRSIRIAFVAAAASLGLAAVGSPVTPAATAEAHSSVTGTVINGDSGTAVANAPLRLVRSDNGWSRLGKADAGGRFTFYNVPDGYSYAVHAEARHRSCFIYAGWSAYFYANHSHSGRTVTIRNIGVRWC